MSLWIHSGQVCVIGKVDLSHLCRLRFGLRLRFNAWQIEADEYQRECGREEQVFVKVGCCHQTSPLIAVESVLQKRRRLEVLKQTNSISVLRQDATSAIHGEDV
jgi:hypothetical protein